MNPPLMNPLVRLTFKNHRAKSEARTALATAPLFLTLGLGLVYGRSENAVPPVGGYRPRGVAPAPLGEGSSCGGALLRAAALC